MPPLLGKRAYHDSLLACGVFTLGLEYTAPELIGSLRTGVPAGLVDLLLSAAPGFLAGMLLGWDPLAALLLAGVTYMTSSGIVAKLLADLGRLGNRETPTVLSILVIELTSAT